MNKILTILFLSTILAGCDREEPLPIEPTEPTCVLDVTVLRCSLFPCDEENTMFLGDVNVQLFESEEDAIEGINVLESLRTDAAGRARFIGADCGLVYVKVESENNGTYISAENLTLASSFNFHEVRFVKNYFFNDDDTASPLQDHISLEFPTVGMTSTYRYFYNDYHISFSPLSYEDNYLTVTIIDQINEHSYIIEERLDNVSGSLSWPSIGSGDPVTRNIWTITDEEVFVSPMQDQYFVSYVWGLTEWAPPEEEGFSFSLIDPQTDEIDMASNSVSEMQNFHGSVSMEDYTLFGNRFENLFGDVYGYTGVDGPLKFRVYSKEDGVVRNLNFYNGGSSASAGFDLILE